MDEDTYRLALDGLIENKQRWTLDQLYALPQETQVTRLICVEGWSAIGKWTGVPLRDFLRRIGADLTAKYVHFACAEGYSVSIDMPTALHPQTQMTFKFDGEILPTRLGFPMRIRIPTKIGFKNPKYVVGMAVLNNYTGGYWEDKGYNWFSGLVRTQLSPAARRSAAPPLSIWPNPSLIVSANSSGVPPAGSSPIAAKRSLKIGELIARLIAALSLSTIGRGMPAGPITPLQVGAA